jgi:hypothetical protein
VENGLILFPAGGRGSNGCRKSTQTTKTFFESIHTSTKHKDVTCQQGWAFSMLEASMWLHSLDALAD